MRRNHDMSVRRRDSVLLALEPGLEEEYDGLRGGGFPRDPAAHRAGIHEDPAREVHLGELQPLEDAAKLLRRHRHGPIYRPAGHCARGRYALGFPSVTRLTEDAVTRPLPMARHLPGLPPEEVTRLERDVPLLDRVRASGITLKRHGDAWL